MAEKYAPSGSETTNTSIDKSRNPKASLQPSKVNLEKNATEIPDSSDATILSCVRSTSQPTYKRNTPSSSSKTAKKPKILTERTTQPVKRKTHDDSSKKPNVGGTELPLKPRSLPSKKAPVLLESKDLGRNERNLDKRLNIRKQSKRTRPLSTDFSLSSTSPAVLRNQAGKMAKVKGSSLRHSWHGMPSDLKSSRGNHDSRRTPQRQKKTKLARKGKSIRICRLSFSSPLTSKINWH